MKAGKVESRALSAGRATSLRNRPSGAATVAIRRIMPWDSMGSVKYQE
jgi:hypothetical protein